MGPAHLACRLCSCDSRQATIPRWAHLFSPVGSAPGTCSPSRELVKSKVRPWRQRTNVWPHETSRWSAARRLRGMTTIVRTLGVGLCSLLGELVDETETRYFYRRRSGNELAFVTKRSPAIHVVPCKACPDYSSPAEEVRLSNL